MPDKKVARQKMMTAIHAHYSAPSHDGWIALLESIRDYGEAYKAEKTYKKTLAEYQRKYRAAMDAGALDDALGWAAEITKLKLQLARDWSL